MLVLFVSLTDRQLQDIDFVRIGRHEVVHEEIQGHCLSGGNRLSFSFSVFSFFTFFFPLKVSMTGMDIRGVKDIKLRLDQVNVVAVTCLGITSPLLAHKSFDICIMDEAGQTTLPVCFLVNICSSIHV